MDLPREPQFYPNDKCHSMEINISVDTKPLDEALKKANQLAGLLKEVQQAINSLSGIEESIGKESKEDEKFPLTTSFAAL